MKDDAAQVGSSPASCCSSFIREHREDILASWQARASDALALARKLDPPELLDQLSAVLSRIADAVDALQAGGSPGPPREEIIAHALERLEEDFEIADLIAELGILRGCILSELETQLPWVPLGEVRLLDQAIDEVVATTSARFAREREHEMRVLADSLPQLIWIGDARGHAIWFNRRLLEYLGAPAEQLRATGPAAYHHPDHLARVTASFRASIAANEAWENTFPLRGSDGRYRWFLSRAIPIRDARGVIVRWFGTNTDVTVQRFLDEATRVLSSSLNYHDTLQQIADLAVPELADWCIVDLVETSGEPRRVAIAHVNPAMIDAAHAWARRYPMSWDAPGSVPNVIRTGTPLLLAEVPDEALVETATDEEQLRALRLLGLKSCIVVPLEARGRTLGAITLLTTESHRRYGPADLRQACELGLRAGIAVDNARLYHESQTALREREQAVRVRDEVLAVVTHDLRGPLGTIQLSASLLEHECASDDARKSLEIIERSAIRMEHMIDDLLDMASIQARGMTLDRVIEDTERIIRDVLDSHLAKAASKGIRIVRECELKSVAVWCDRDRVERVFGNLIGNAIKYCGRGDVIYVRGHRLEAQAMFSVADSGPGIPPDQLPYLFDPYWTAKRAGTTGTGLGLYICKGIVEAHGGRLWVDSKEARGTEFFFTLPLA